MMKTFEREMEMKQKSYPHSVECPGIYPWIFPASLSPLLSKYSQTRGFVFLVLVEKSRLGLLPVLRKGPPPPEENGIS